MPYVIEVLEAQRQKFAAQAGSDPEALRPLLADDLIYAHASGKVDDKESLLASVAQRGYLGIERKQTAVRIFGDVAVITGIVDMHIHASLRFDAQFTDVWVRGEHWKNVAWQSTIIKS